MLGPDMFRLPAEDNALVSFLGGVTERGSTAPATGDAPAQAAPQDIDRAHSEPCLCTQLRWH
jgi:hypothetical protein